MIHTDPSVFEINDVPVRGILYGGARTGQNVPTFLGVMDKQLREGKIDSVGKILAVEPNPAAHQSLKNYQSPRLRLFQTALADFDGLTSYFDIPQYPWFNSILSPDPDFFKKRYGEARVNSIELHEIQVQCCRIDSLLRDADEEPNVLYLNIQGAELQALNGATRSLETFVDAVFLEINYDRRYLSCPLYDEIDAFLSGYGFIPSYIHRYPWAHFGHGEALFVRPRKIRRAHHGTNEPGEPPHVTP